MKTIQEAVGMTEIEAKELVQFHEELKQKYSKKKLDMKFWGILSQVRYSSWQWNLARGNYQKEVTIYKQKYQKLFMWLEVQENYGTLDFVHMAANIATLPRWPIIIKDISGILGDIVSEFIIGDKTILNDEGLYNNHDKVADEYALRLYNNKEYNSATEAFISDMKQAKYDYNQLLKEPKYGKFYINTAKVLSKLLNRSSQD